MKCNQYRCEICNNTLVADPKGNCVQEFEIPKNFYIREVKIYSDKEFVLAGGLHQYISKFAFKCPGNCLTCQNLNYCTKCQIGYHKILINDNQVCVEKCPKGFTLKKLGKLERNYTECVRIPCNVKNCQKCKKANYCSVCKKFSESHKLLIPFLGQCIECTPKNGLTTQVSLSNNSSMGLTTDFYKKKLSKNDVGLIRKGEYWKWYMISSKNDRIEHDWLEFKFTFTPNQNFGIEGFMIEQGKILFEPIYNKFKQVASKKVTIQFRYFNELYKGELDQFFSPKNPFHGNCLSRIGQECQLCYAYNYGKTGCQHKIAYLDLTGCL